MKEARRERGREGQEGRLSGGRVIIVSNNKLSDRLPNYSIPGYLITSGSLRWKKLREAGGNFLKHEERKCFRERMLLQAGGEGVRGGRVESWPV